MIAHGRVFRAELRDRARDAAAVAGTRAANYEGRMGQPASPAIELLHALLGRHAGGEAMAWLARSRLPSAEPGARAAFFAAFAGAQRRFGSAQPQLSPEECARLDALRGPRAQRWSLAELARALLLLRALAALPEGEHLALVTEALRKGDTGERVATLRALSLLPSPERFVELAIDACRSHVLDVFEAVACDNPFPARFFPEANFNQLVMKALFVELPLSRVVELGARLNPELTRMARDYAAERRAAGRVVPADVALIMQMQTETVR